MNQKSNSALRWIRWSNPATFLVLLSGSILFYGDSEVVFGVLFGGCISLASFEAMVRLMRSSTGESVNLGLLLLKLSLKFLVLAVSVGAILLWTAVDPIAFAAGLSITVVSICLVGFFQPSPGPSGNLE